MTRIIVPTGTLIGRELVSLTQQIIGASQAVNRLKAQADAITTNGASPALLESSTESLMPTGTGSTIYTGIGTIKTQLDALATLVATIDQG
jgi:multidrug transporter EmrE-like cation transporter